MATILKFENAAVFINEYFVCATNVNITIENNLEPLYVLGKRNKKQEMPGGGMVASIQLQYYPLAEDIIYNMINASEFVTFEIGKMKFERGCVTNFRVEGNYGSPILCSANLVFYNTFVQGFLGEDLSPGLQPDVIQIPHSLTSQISNDLYIEGLSEFEYAQSVEVSPVYRVGEFVLDEVRWNKRKIEMSINGERLDQYISLYGQSANISIDLRDLCGDQMQYVVLRDRKYTISDFAVRKTIYNCNGKIVSANLSFDPDNHLGGKLSIIQYI